MDSRNYFDYSNHAITYNSPEKRFGAYDFLTQLKDDLESGQAIEAPRDSDIATIARTICEGYQKAYNERRWWICRVIDSIKECFGISTQYSKISDVYQKVLSLATHIPKPIVSPPTKPTEEKKPVNPPSPPSPPPETTTPIQPPEHNSSPSPTSVASRPTTPPSPVPPSAPQIKPISPPSKPAENVISMPQPETKPERSKDDIQREKEKTEEVTTKLKTQTEFTTSIAPSTEIVSGLEQSKLEEQKSIKDNAKKDLQIEKCLAFITGLQKKLNNTSFEQELKQLEDLKAHSTDDIILSLAKYEGILTKPSYDYQELASVLVESMGFLKERKTEETFDGFVLRMENTVQSLVVVLKTKLIANVPKRPEKTIKDLCEQGLQRIKEDAEKEKQRLDKLKQLTEEDLNFVKTVAKKLSSLESHTKSLGITRSFNSIFIELECKVTQAQKQLSDVQKKFNLSKSQQLKLESLETDLNSIRSFKYISHASKETLQNQLNAAKQTRKALDLLQSLSKSSSDINQIKEAVVSFEKEFQERQPFLVLMGETNKEFTSELSTLKQEVAGLAYILELGQKWQGEPIITDLEKSWKEIEAACKVCEKHSISKAIYEKAKKAYSNFKKNKSS